MEVPLNSVVVIFLLCRKRGLSPDNQWNQSIHLSRRGTDPVPVSTESKKIEGPQDSYGKKWPLPPRWESRSDRGSYRYGK